MLGCKSNARGRIFFLLNKMCPLPTLPILLDEESYYFAHKINIASMAWLLLTFLSIWFKLSLGEKDMCSERLVLLSLWCRASQSQEKTSYQLLERK